MNLTIETIMTAVYFDPEKVVNIHGLIYMYFTHKPEGM